MNRYIIAIILGNKIIERILVNANSEDQAFDKTFQWADQILGENKEYELFNLSNPRHSVLFEKELADLF